MNTLQRILYVEDEPDIREIAKLALEAVGGFRVKLCGSGAEALAHVTDFHPQLILLDVIMPDMDGPATLRALRDVPAAAQIPVIFMTAKVQPQEVAEYREMGAIGVIPKPFDPTTLSDQIRSLWMRCND